MSSYVILDEFICYFRDELSISRMNIAQGTTALNIVVSNEDVANYLRLLSLMVQRGWEDQLTSHWHRMSYDPCSVQPFLIDS